LMAWSQSPEKKVDIDFLLSGGPLHAYHALLIADYMGKVDEPNKYFVNVLAGGGADKHMLQMMGDVYARQGHKDIAVKIYDTLLEEAEKGNAINSRYFALEEKRQDLSKATMSKIQTPSQGAAELFYNMARILFQDQSDDSALVFSRLSAQLDPTKDDAKMLVAGMMARAGHINDAVEMYRGVKPQSLGYPEAQRSAAELLEKEGKIDDAIAFLEQNYTVTKETSNIVQIGDIYRRASRHSDAIKAYDRAIDLLGGKVSSDHWEILFARGMSFEQLGNFKKAEEELMAALEFQPDHPYLLNYLGYSWADQGKKLDQSLEMIQKAVTIKPDDGYIVDSLGWVYYKVKRYDEAVAELERAVELVPYDPIINDHLGDAYWQVGRKNEARFQWARAMNHTKDSADIAKLEQKINLGLVEKETPVKEAATKPDLQHQDTVKHP
jgi:tetratricopeptide (TPR) repeat protein